MTAFAPGLSVVLITRNEAARIERCLNSVAFADETVVLDGASTDNTADIARRLGARVVVDPAWPGFGIQKNRVLGMAQREWVLSLDADEALTEELAVAIRQIVGQQGHLVSGTTGGAADQVAARDASEVNGYWIARRSCFAGRPLRFGDWASDEVLRLVRNGRARFTELPVHEQLQCEPPVARLPGLLMHYTLDSMVDARDKALRYATAAAPGLARRGRGGLVAAALHASWTFLRGTVLRLGVLDGRYGLMLAWANAYGTWLRYRLAGRLRRTVDHD